MGVCVCVKAGMSGHYLNWHFPAEWERDCSIFLKSDDATFYFSTLIPPFLNALWKIGSSERTLVLSAQ